MDGEDVNLFSFRTMYVQIVTFILFYIYPTLFSQIVILGFCSKWMAAKILINSL